MRTKGSFIRFINPFLDVSKGESLQAVEALAVIGDQQQIMMIAAILPDLFELFFCHCHEYTEGFASLELGTTVFLFEAGASQTAGNFLESIEVADTAAAGAAIGGSTAIGGSVETHRFLMSAE
jgi:hypothetical protein